MKDLLLPSVGSVVTGYLAASFRWQQLT